jgi:predicted ATPase
MQPSALEHITVKGFKSIRSIERLPLTPINVLIGSNGSGKSNFISVFSFLHAIREGRLQTYVRAAGGAEQVLYFGSKVTEECEFHLAFLNEVSQYRIALRPTEDDSLYPWAEQVFYWPDKKKYAKPYDEGLAPRGAEAGISNPNLAKTAGWLRNRIGGWRVYHVHDTSPSSPMRKTAQIDDNAFLRPDGSNLAAFLYLLAERYPDAYRLIRGSVQRVMPFFDDFMLRPDPLNERTIRLAWKHKNSDQYFGAAALSDGTLRFITLATLFLQPLQLRPSIIIVDEPELGLHPFAVTFFASMVKQAAVETQVILSTQSTLLLDHFRPEDVLVADRIEGGTQLNRLEDSRLESWLQDYSLGQLWEKNEIGGRPSRG